jgi:hypothetical protein
MLFALIIGRSRQGHIVTEMIRVNDRRYQWAVRDEEHQFSFQLAGKRCFEALPLDSEWNAVRQQYDPYYMQRLELVDSQSLDTVNRLRC